MKSLLLKFKQGTLEVRLINTLAVMRLSPDADGISPARMLLGWQPEMPIAKICPCAVDVPPAAPAKFEVGDPVYYRVFPVVRYGPKWREGVIFKKEGVNAKTYIVFGSQDHYVRRAACHVRGRGRGGRPPYPRADYLDTVGQNPVDTTDRSIILSPYAFAYGRLRTPEEQARDNRESRRDALERLLPAPAPIRHRLRPAGVESPSEDDSEEDWTPPGTPRPAREDLSPQEQGSPGPYPTKGDTADIRSPSSAMEGGTRMGTAAVRRGPFRAPPSLPATQTQSPVSSTGEDTLRPDNNAEPLEAIPHDRWAQMSRNSRKKCVKRAKRRAERRVSEDGAGQGERTTPWVFPLQPSVRSVPEQRTELIIRPGHSTSTLGHAPSQEATGGAINRGADDGSTTKDGHGIAPSVAATAGPNVKSSDLSETPESLPEHPEEPTPNGFRHERAEVRAREVAVSLTPPGVTSLQPAFFPSPWKESKSPARRVQLGRGVTRS